jgi:cytochrome bd-type quinol oxidase subunit 2
MNKDLDHLKILGILHTIWGVLAILCGLGFGLLYILLASAGTMEVSGGMTPETARGVFVVVGIVAIVLSTIYGVLMMMAGGKLRKQRGYGFCFFVSILDLFGFPGIVLGIFTLIVLLRPTVKELFKGHGALASSKRAQTVAPVV